MEGYLLPYAPPIRAKNPHQSGSAPIRLNVMKNGARDAKAAVPVVGPDLANVRLYDTCNAIRLRISLTEWIKSPIIASVCLYRWKKILKNRPKESEKAIQPWQKKKVIKAWMNWNLFWWVIRICTDFYVVFVQVLGAVHRHVEPTVCCSSLVWPRRKGTSYVTEIAGGSAHTNVITN